MIVLGASALVDVVADRPLKDAVLDRIDGERILSPGHQLAEVSSALAHLLRAGDLDLVESEHALAEAASLGQELVVPDAKQLLRALALADRIRVLDGIYVAIAEERRCPLVTTDGRLARSNPPCEVHFAGV